MTRCSIPFRHTAFATCIASAIVLAFAPAGRAEVTNISAALEAGSTELLSGEAGSTDSSIEMFPETAPTLPAEALSGLGDFSGELGLGHGVRSIAGFDDPTLSSESNPMELGVEAVSYSDVSAISYEGVAEIIETREIVLTPEDLNVNTTGESNLVFSTVFIDGAIVVWTSDPARDLTGLAAEFEFDVVQDTSTGGELVVFDSETSVTGEPDGGVKLTHSSILEVILGGPELIEGATSAETQQLIELLNASGRIHIALVPTQEVQYAYFANADEPFNLRAEVSCRTLNLPDGTGAAVVFGQDFSAIAPALEPFLQEPKGVAVQDAINRALRTAQNDDDSLTRSLGTLCGALGMEAMLVTLAGLFSFRFRAARRV